MIVKWKYLRGQNNSMLCLQDLSVFDVRRDRPRNEDDLSIFFGSVPPVTSVATLVSQNFCNNRDLMQNQPPLSA